MMPYVVSLSPGKNYMGDVLHTYAIGCTHTTPTTEARCYVIADAAIAHAYVCWLLFGQAGTYSPLGTAEGICQPCHKVIRGKGKYS